MRNPAFFLISIALFIFPSCKKDETFLYKLLSDENISGKGGIPKVPDITSNLVAYYPFSGNTNDYSGNGNNGIAYGATLTTDRNGRSNKAYELNGISNYIEVPTPFFNNGWENMTISLWFYPKSYGASLTRGRTFFNTSPHNGFAMGYSYDGSEKIYAYKHSDPSNPGWDILQQNNFNFIPPTLNKWYHVAIVKSGLNYIYYINGSHDKTVSTSTTPVAYNCKLLIGCISSYEEYFQGKIDEIRIYDRSLTNEQIAFIYNQ